MSALAFYQSLNKHNMMGPISRRSIEHSSSMIDQVLNRGSELLYDHYLVERLPEHATLQNVLIVKGIMNSETYMPQKSRQIPKDNPPQRMQQDSLASKSVHVKRLPNCNARLQAKPMLGQKLQIRNRTQRLQRTSVSRSANTKEFLSTSSPLIQLKSIEPSPQEAQVLLVEDGMRKRKHQEEMILEQNTKKEQEEHREKQEQQQKMRDHYHELEHKNLRYTYDFDGKIIGCGPVNAHTPLFSKSLCPQIRLKFDEDKIQKKQTPKVSRQRREQNNQRSNTSKSEMFKSMAFNSVHGSKLMKALRGNGMGAQYVRNETFNNNNNRQVSNVNIISMSDGSKLTEIESEVVIASDRKEPVTLRQFTERIAKNRYKSFLEASQNAEIEDFDGFYSPEDCKDSRGETTKLPSSMSGRTKKYTFRETINNEPLSSKPMTAASNRRKISELTRPKTTSHKFGRVIANETLVDILFQ